MKVQITVMGSDPETRTFGENVKTVHDALKAGGYDTSAPEVRLNGKTVRMDTSLEEGKTNRIFLAKPKKGGHS